MARRGIRSSARAFNITKGRGAIRPASARGRRRDRRRRGSRAPPPPAAGGRTGSRGGGRCRSAAGGRPPRGPTRPAGPPVESPGDQGEGGAEAHPHQLDPPGSTSGRARRWSRARRTAGGVSRTPARGRERQDAARAVGRRRAGVGVGEGREHHPARVGHQVHGIPAGLEAAEEHQQGAAARAGRNREGVSPPARPSGRSPPAAGAARRASRRPGCSPGPRPRPAGTPGEEIGSGSRSRSPPANARRSARTSPQPQPRPLRLP